MKNYLIESMNFYMEKLNESIVTEFEKKFNPDGNNYSGYAAHTEKELADWANWLDARNVSYSYDDDPSFLQPGYYAELVIDDEFLTEARNLENDEVNAIIKKHLGKKSRISKKEQEILDKYGISRDEYGRFMGKNGERLFKSGTIIYGPHHTDRYRTQRRWNLSKGYNNPNYQETADSFDNVDFANYLNKDHGDTTDTDRAIYNRRKNKWGDDYDSTQSENDALRPYSDEYKALKQYETREKNWLNYNKNEYPYDSDEDIEKKVAEYKQKLLRDRDANKQRVDSSQADYDKASKELNDFRDSIKAKQAAKKKNESLSLKEELNYDDLTEILYWCEKMCDKVGWWSSSDPAGLFLDRIFPYLNETQIQYAISDIEDDANNEE